MTNPPTPENDAFAKAPAGAYPAAPLQGPGPGYGAPQAGYQGYGVVRGPRRPYAPALAVAAVGFLLEAVGAFLYWPTRDFSITMSRAAAACTGLGFLVLAVAGLVAALSRPN